MVDKSENKRVHRLPISTCGNAKVDKSGRFFRIFYFFFYFFSYTPFYLLLCNYPIFTKHPVLSAIMRFFHFFDPLFTLFCTFSHPYNQERSVQSPNHDDSKPLSRADARTPPTPAYFFYTFCSNLWATATLAQNGILGLRVSLLKKLKPFSYHPPTFKAWPPNAIIPCRIKK